MSLFYQKNLKTYHHRRVLSQVVKKYRKILPYFIIKIGIDLGKRYGAKVCKNYYDLMCSLPQRGTAKINYKLKGNKSFSKCKLSTKY
jgi:hypothetical protein